jgi:hypothetical protein
MDLFNPEAAIEKAADMFDRDLRNDNFVCPWSDAMRTCGADTC